MIDPRMCTTSLAIANLLVLLLICLVATGLVVRLGLYAGDVVLFCFVVLYELLVLQLVLLAIARRRSGTWTQQGGELSAALNS